MDRSFLSDPTVVTASRRFVCVRLLTYESAEEAKVLTSFFVGRSGELENTTFALLSSDGKTKLARAGRSPDFAFRGGAGTTPAQEMAVAMDEIAMNSEKSATGTLAPAELPLTDTVRRGLDVAACDGLPFVVVLGEDGARRDALVARLAPLSWNAQNLGRFVYAVASSTKDLDPIRGVAGKTGVVVVEPDAYGATGTVLAHAAGDSDVAKIAAALVEGLKRHRAPAPKDIRRHIQEGLRLGIHWETVIPETDPGPPGGGPPPEGR